jgi:hypothetical protein
MAIWTYRIHDNKTMKSNRQSDRGPTDDTVILIVDPEGQDRASLHCDSTKQARTICANLNRTLTSDIHN